MKSIKRNTMRCGILRSEPAETVSGFVTSLRARSITVLVAPRTGLELDEAVVVKVDSAPTYPVASAGCMARLYSRVVSIIWRDAGDLVGLAVRTAKASDFADFECQPSKLAPLERIS